jgi:integrase
MRKPSEMTLADVLKAVHNRSDLSPITIRNYRLCIQRISRCLGTCPEQVSLDLIELTKRLDAVNTYAHGFGKKRWSNMRSVLRNAIHASGLIPGMIGGTNAALSPRWREIRRRLRTKSEICALSRLITFGHRCNPSPSKFDDRLFAKYGHHLRTAVMLRQNADRIIWTSAQTWNAVAKRETDLNLPILTVPARTYQARRRRFPWAALPGSFRDDVVVYLDHLGQLDLWDFDDPRRKPYATKTLQITKDYIHSAANWAVAAGVDAKRLRSLRDLVEHFEVIARHRANELMKCGSADGHTPQKAYLRDVLSAMARINRWHLHGCQRKTRWMHRVAYRFAPRRVRMAERNESLLRAVETPRSAQRLLTSGIALWPSVLNKAVPRRSLLARAQAILAVEILNFHPIRRHNLTRLAFGEHIHLGKKATDKSVLWIPAAEVKGQKNAIYMEIPDHLARMLTEFKEEVAPEILGYQPTLLFVNQDGSQKSPHTLYEMITGFTRRYVGTAINPHAFRHIAANRLLDDNPGAHCVARDLLGHEDVEITASFYAGRNTRRAGRHYNSLLEKQITASLRKLDETGRSTEERQRRLSSFGPPPRRQKLPEAKTGTARGFQHHLKRVR